MRELVVKDAKEQQAKVPQALEHFRRTGETVVIRQRGQRGGLTIGVPPKKVIVLPKDDRDYSHISFADGQNTHLF